MFALNLSYSSTVLAGMLLDMCKRVIFKKVMNADTVASQSRHFQRNFETKKRNTLFFENSSQASSLYPI